MRPRYCARIALGPSTGMESKADATGGEHAGPPTQLAPHHRLAEIHLGALGYRLAVACTFPFNGCPIRGTLDLLQPVLKGAS